MPASIRLDRRRFLRMAGAGAAAGAIAPFLPIFESGVSAGGEFPHRHVVFHTGNGTVHDAWRPSGSETSFTLSRILAPLEAFKDRLVICDGLNQRVFDTGPGRPHGRAAAQLLTGFPLTADSDGAAGGMSVDQFIAGELRDRGLARTPFRSMELGAFRVTHEFLFSGPNLPIPQEADPRRAFERFLAGAGGGDGATVDPRIAQRLAERGRVFDVVASQIRGVEGELRGSDRERMQRHLAAIESVQAELAATAMPRGACSVVSPDFGGIGDPRSSAMYPVVAPLHCSVARLALACDQTRVVSIILGTSGNTRLYPTWLGISDEHHDIGHRAGGDSGMREKQIRIEEYHAGLFRDFLTELDSVDEGGPGQSLLDHSIVVWINSLADGGHGMVNLPVVIAGSGGGVLRTGRFMSFGGASHCDLLTSLCHLMGLGDVAKFGDPSFGSGPLSGLA